MKTFAAVIIAGCSLALPYAARAERVGSQTTPVSFSVTVQARPVSGTTFWVSYGPLAGKFGIVQMHAEGAHTYGVTLNLPAQARGTFYYLTGHGRMKTRIGLVPGNPVQTFKHVGPMLISRGEVVTASWHPPIG